jgi:hypothetical protein
MYLTEGAKWDAVKSRTGKVWGGVRSAAGATGSYIKKGAKGEGVMKGIRMVHAARGNRKAVLKSYAPEFGRAAAVYGGGAAVAGGAAYLAHRAWKKRKERKQRHEDIFTPQERYELIGAMLEVMCEEEDGDLFLDEGRVGDAARATWRGTKWAGRKAWHGTKWAGRKVRRAPAAAYHKLARKYHKRRAINADLEVLASKRRRYHWKSALENKGARDYYGIGKGIMERHWKRGVKRNELRGAYHAYVRGQHEKAGAGHAYKW